MELAARASAQTRPMTMLYPVMVLELALIVVLLGVLFRIGEAGRDVFFTSYLAVLFLANAISWLTVQSAFGQRLHQVVYVGLCAILLVAASLLVLRMPGGWMAVGAALVLGQAALWVAEATQGLERAIPDYIQMQMVLFLAHLSFGGFCAWRASLGGAAFDSTKFAGLALFWLSQAAVSAAYVLGWMRTKPVWNEAIVASIGAGAIAMAWMIFSFWSVGMQGLPAEAGKAEKKDEGRGGWMEVEHAKAARRDGQR